MDNNKKKELIRSIKFTLFSISAGAIQIISFTLLTLLTELRYWPSYLIALVLSVLYNFTINRKFTFHSANNVPVAMLKVFGYYCIFTPFSVVLGDYLVEVLRWNSFVVLIVSMMINFVTEFLFTRFIVYGKDVDTSKSYLEKHEGEKSEKSAGPVIGKTSIVVCALLCVVGIAATVLILAFGYTPENRMIGKWISYSSEGDEISYTFHDDGTVDYVNETGGINERMTYRFEDGRMTMTTPSADFVYLWDGKAVGFLVNNEHDAIMAELSQMSETVPNFYGYLCIEGDLMYLGTKTLCRAEAYKNADDASLWGDWVGVKGDAVKFRFGTCKYIEEGDEYAFTYTVDEKENLFLIDKENNENSLVFSKDEWSISGNVLYFNNRYYFKNEK